MSDNDLIKTNIANGVAEIAFNRPRQLNAFNNELMHQTLDAMTHLNQDDDVRAIIVRGEGRAFSAGFDLKASAERKLETVSDIRAQMELQFDFITQFLTSR